MLFDYYYRCSGVDGGAIFSFGLPELTLDSDKTFRVKPADCPACGTYHVGKAGHGFLFQYTAADGVKSYGVNQKKHADENYAIQGYLDSQPGQSKYYKSYDYGFIQQIGDDCNYDTSILH
jgi:hypothetical protein